ncbi:hypothetical protein V5O48_006245 [Marasmius crinis-equi]|uniref:Uncharacterized protein n=1 Tax=Marasmius crinis-equi TaxID=585013 RepID=A0ABR3FK23_9AGAR
MSNNTGIIVGAVIGVVLLILILIPAIGYARRQKKKIARAPVIVSSLRDFIGASRGPSRRDQRDVERVFDEAEEESLIERRKFSMNENPYADTVGSSGGNRGFEYGNPQAFDTSRTKLEAIHEIQGQGARPTSGYSQLSFMGGSNPTAMPLPEPTTAPHMPLPLPLAMHRPSTPSLSRPISMIEGSGFEITKEPLSLDPDDNEEQKDAVSDLPNPFSNSKRSYTTASINSMVTSESAQTHGHGQLTVWDGVEACHRPEVTDADSKEEVQPLRIAKRVHVFDS